MRREAAEAAARPATARLRGSLGDQALLDIDGTTGTPRLVTRLDGFLTGHEPPERRRRGPRLRRRPPRRPRPDRQGPQDLPPASRLRRHGRDAPPVLDPEGRRGRRVRQRVDRGRDPGRAAASASPAPPSPGAAPAGTTATRLDTGDRRSPRPASDQGELRRPGRPRHRPPGAVRDPRRHAPRLEHRDHVGGSPGADACSTPHTGGLLFRRSLSSEAGPGDKTQGQRRSRLPVLPPRPQGRQPGVGGLHGEGLAGRQRHQALRQQLARLLRRQRRQQGAGLRGGRAVQRAPLGLRAAPVHGPRRVVLRQPLPLLVGPERPVLVAGQPRPERVPGVLLRQQLARPPEGRTDRVHRGGGQLPAPQHHPGRCRR